MPSAVASRIWRRLTQPLWSKRVSHALYPVGGVAASGIGIVLVVVLGQFPRLHEPREWCAPVFCIAVGALMLRRWTAYHRARWNRRRRGRCGNCGYDLRASPARCPECGTPAA